MFADARNEEVNDLLESYRLPHQNLQSQAPTDKVNWGKSKKRLAEEDPGQEQGG